MRLPLIQGSKDNQKGRTVDGEGATVLSTTEPNSRVKSTDTEDTRLLFADKALVIDAGVHVRFRCGVTQR